MAYRRAAHGSGRLPITSPATALFHFNPGLPVPLPADPSGTRSELIACVAAEASSAVLKDRLSADRRCFNSPDACRPAALCDTGECTTARDASPKAHARHAGTALPA